MLRLAAILVYPYIPETAGRIWRQLGLGDEMKGTERAGWTWSTSADGIVVEKGDVLFPKTSRRLSPRTTLLVDVRHRARARCASARCKCVGSV